MKLPRAGDEYIVKDAFAKVHNIAYFTIMGLCVSNGDTSINVRTPKGDFRNFHISILENYYLNN